MKNIVPESNWIYKNLCVNKPEGKVYVHFHWGGERERESSPEKVGDRKFQETLFEIYVLSTGLSFVRF